MELPVVEVSEQFLSVQEGTTNLKIVQYQNATPYHLAINIPSYDK
jgi:hypothetical protein